jgi:hypothetical protein
MVGFQWSKLGRGAPPCLRKKNGDGNRAAVGHEYVYMRLVLAFQDTWQELRSLTNKIPFKFNDEVGIENTYAICVVFWTSLFPLVILWQLSLHFLAVLLFLATKKLYATSWSLLSEIWLVIEMLFRWASPSVLVRKHWHDLWSDNCTMYNVALRLKLQKLRDPSVFLRANCSIVYGVA